MLNIKKIELEPIPVPGHGMCKFYPTNRFEPISPKEFDVAWLPIKEWRSL